MVTSSSSMYALHGALERVTVGQTKIQLQQTEQRASRINSIFSKLNDQAILSHQDTELQKMPGRKSTLPGLCNLSYDPNDKKKQSGRSDAVWHFESQMHGWRQLPKNVCTRLESHLAVGAKYSSFRHRGKHLKPIIC